MVVCDFDSAGCASVDAVAAGCNSLGGDVTINVNGLGDGDGGDGAGGG